MKKALALLGAAVGAGAFDHYQPTGVDGWTTCVMKDGSESCPISNMQRDQSSVVEPGGDTRCIYSGSTPFGFQVIPGDADKLLFYFQGGGACWDELSTRVGACTTNASPDDLQGVFDRTNHLNPFRNYTVVNVLYCSGDVHGGNTTRPYNDPSHKPVQQSGYANARAAMDWTLANMQPAGAAPLSSLVVSGCSAGSIGAQLWSDVLLTEFAYDKAAVVADSYIGVFPPGLEGPLIEDFGFCDTALTPSDLESKCESGELELQDLFERSMDQYPATPFAHIQSKYDKVQREYYVGLTVTNDKPGDVIRPIGLTKNAFADEMNEMLEIYDTHKNYVSYVVTSNQHCYTPFSLFYEADATSAYGGGDGVSLLDWLGGFPLETEEDTVDSVCDGPEKEKGQWHGHVYCDAAQEGKTFPAAAKN